MCCSKAVRKLKRFSPADGKRSAFVCGNRPIETLRKGQRYKRAAFPLEECTGPLPKRPYACAVGILAFGSRQWTKVQEMTHPFNLGL
jgi:hypothetical protein